MFASKRLDAYVMDVGTYMIGVVKTNTKGFYRDTIQNLTNDWTVGSCLVLKSKHMVPGEFVVNSREFTRFGLATNYTLYHHLPSGIKGRGK